VIPFRAVHTEIVSPTTSSPLRLRIWLVSGILAGVTLRLWGLSGQIMFGDELHAIQTVVNLDLGRILTTYRLADHCMPMSGYDRVLVDAGLHLTEILVRAPAFIAGLLTLMVLPFAISRLGDRGSATVFAWLLALSPTLVFYSRIGRPYAVIVLLGFLAAACFWRFRETGRVRWGVAYAAFGALSAWSHPGVGPFVAAPLAFGAIEALFGPRPERVKRLTALAGLAVLLGALIALFLVPAWRSFLRLLRAKGAASEPESWDVTGAMMLQAGTGVPWVAGLFWALVVFGAWVLWRRHRPVALYAATLFLVQLASVVVFRPYRVESALVLNRYLLVTLPVVLLWAAHGLTGLWRIGTARLVARLAAVGVVLALVVTHPYATDPWLRLGPFGASNEAARFSEPAPVLPEAAVPEVYRLLGREAGRGAVVEVPSAAAWFRVRPELSLARIHGRPVVFATTEDWLKDPALSFRTLLPAEPDAVLASGARFLIVDLDRQRLWRTIVMIRRHELDPDQLEGNDLERLVPATPARSDEAQFARRMAERFEAAWGPPQLVDGTVRVWDLAVVAESSGSPRSRQRSGTGVRPGVLEQGAPAQAEPVGVPEAERAEGGEGVGARAPEADARRLVEVADRHGDVAEAEAEVDGLEEQLGVEHEVVRVLLERDRFQELPGVPPEAAVPLAQVLAGEHVFEQRQAPVRQVLDPGHAPRKRLAPGADAVAEDQVEDPQAEDLDRRRHQPGVVLVVRMDHDHVVGAPIERLPVAGLLITPVAEVPLVADERDRQALGDLRCVVPARVVDHDHLVAAAVREPGKRGLQGLGRVVGGHDDDGALTHLGYPINRVRDGAGEAPRSGRIRLRTVSSPGDAVTV